MAEQPQPKEDDNAFSSATRRNFRSEVNGMWRGGERTTTLGLSQDKAKPDLSIRLHSPFGRGIEAVAGEKATPEGAQKLLNKRYDIRGFTFTE